ncbi:uncharacterized protein V1513DRAFT_453201 [Lipomyces chichibuensis]|uniref:uncharacterized protein n=1 Tax=Lipomyces chichibuensis TaxID=1546026 RepID=UPI0033434CBE
MSQAGHISSHHLFPIGQRLCCDSLTHFTSIMKDEVFRYFSRKEDNGKTFESKFCKQTWSTNDRRRFIKHLVKCPKSPAELKTAMEYRVAEIGTAILKREISIDFECRRCNFPTG